MIEILISVRLLLINWVNFRQVDQLGCLGRHVGVPELPTQHL
jgi:hypothetical protein